MSLPSSNNVNPAQDNLIANASQAAQQKKTLSAEDIQKLTLLAAYRHKLTRYNTPFDLKKRNKKRLKARAGRKASRKAVGRK